MSWHFMVPQGNREVKEFTDEGRKFEVVSFSGSNERGGMFGQTSGCVVNQIEPEKRTVLFTRSYYSCGAGRSFMCEVSCKFIDGIDAFATKHNITLYGKPDTMLEETDGHLFTPSKWSSDMIKLHPDDPAYDPKDDPDLEKK